jgi:hypothetical protein
MLPAAALVGFALSWPRIRRPTPAMRVVFEVFLITLGAALLIWLGWALLWFIEQRW